MRAKFFQHVGAAISGSRPAELDETRMDQRLHSLPVPAGFRFVQLPLQIREFLKHREIVMAVAGVQRTISFPFSIFMPHSKTSVPLFGGVTSTTVV